MEKGIRQGYAFILEGDTEKEFYHSFLTYLCQKYGVALQKIVDTSDPDIIYEIQTDDDVSIIKFRDVGTITQVTQQGKWFQTQCVDKYGKELEWYVFLCYDTDKYSEDISKFHEGDWADLRKKLQEAKKIIDVAASAEIEDVMLQDIASICRFIHCEPSVALQGRTGKAKLKKLFREHGCCYHEGSRARTLIDSLDMEVLIAGNLVPLKEIEQIIFE